MSDLPYVRAYEKISAFFDTVINSEVPQKFTYRFFSSIGFPSSKDRDLVPLIKKLKLIDEGNRPTEAYIKLRDKKEYKKVLGERIKIAYKELFEMDSRANFVSEKILNGYFGRLTGESYGKAVVYTKTFLVLCSLAGFNKKAEKTKVTPNLNININLSIDKDNKDYEKIFSSLRDLLAR